MPVGLTLFYCNSLGGRRLHGQRRPVTAVSGVHRALWGRRRRLQSQRRPVTAVSGVHRALWGETLPPVQPVRLLRRYCRRSGGRRSWRSLRTWYALPRSCHRLARMWSTKSRPPGRPSPLASAGWTRRSWWRLRRNSCSWKRTGSSGSQTALGHRG